MKRGGKLLFVVVLVCLIVGVTYAAGPDTVVYITNTGEKYHTGRCVSVRKSKTAISLGQAVSRGYEPCKRCKPPTLD